MSTAAAVQVALLGLPNTGKSTLYNRLTGGHAHVANWPGLTVELLRGSLPADADGRPYDLVDLPGIHDLSGSSEDEEIVRRFLSVNCPDLAVVVLNASHADTQLRLALELQATGLPLILALNMGDEAQRFGVRIDHQRLEAELGLPVLVISARQGRASKCCWNVSTGLPGSSQGLPDCCQRRSWRRTGPAWWRAASKATTDRIRIPSGTDLIGCCYTRCWDS